MAHHLKTDDIKVEGLDGATLTNLNLQIKPIERAVDEESVQVFFDDGGIITLEMYDLELIGSGRMVDPETGNKETIEFNGPIKSGAI